jgi:hypothetical protein
MQIREDAGEVALSRPARQEIGLFDARLPFLATLTLAPLYGVVDMLQQVTPGPATAFSEFYAQPAGVHALTFVAIYLLAWLVWYVVLRATGAGRRPDHPLLRASEVRAARPVLRVYLALVLVVVGVVALLHTLSLGMAIQAALLVFTYLYAALRARRGYPAER